MSVLETEPRLIAQTSVAEPLHVLFVQTEEAASIEALGVPPYEQWIANASGLSLGEIHTVNVADNPHTDPLPQSLNIYDAVILGGSGHNTNENEPWMQRTKDFMRAVGQSGTPEYDICFSYQLKNEAHGGTVKDREEGYNFGIERAHVTEAGRDHPIMRDLPEEMLVFKSHGRVVTDLPPSTPDMPVSVLSVTPSGFEAVAIGNAVAQQGHGELTLPIATALAARRRPKLVAAGLLDASPEAFQEFLAGLHKDGQQAEAHGRRMAGNFIEHIVIPHRQIRARG